MQLVRVHFYAGLREKARCSEVSISWPVSGSLSLLREKLSLALPEISHALRETPVIVAVNDEMAREDFVIQAGDEVSLMPPFSGGSGAKTPPQSLKGMEVRIQTGAFSIEEEIRRVRCSSRRIGAVCAFLGTARDFSRGRMVKGLLFEHHPLLAERKMAQIRIQAIRRFGLIEASIMHRTGPVGLGEDIVLVVAAAEHRDEAFQACRWCIDELKASVPIWKKESSSSGESWINDRP